MIETTRLASRLGEGDTPRESRAVRRCEAALCLEATRREKPYCTAHVVMHPYAAALEAEVEQRASERAALKVGAEPLPHGLIAGELLAEVRGLGVVSIAQLGRLTRLTASESEQYVFALERAGLVSLKVTKRGAVVVRLAVA